MPEAWKMSTIAVIGSGIGGLGAAWSLSRDHQVTVYEADDRLGGHANTIEVEDPRGPIAVDTGFIVYNEANYPNLVQLFSHLGVATEPSDMAFSVSLSSGAFEYQARASGLLAQPSNLVRPGYVRMIADIMRFAREAPSSRPGGDVTTREFLDGGGYSEAFRRDFLLPVLACIWSSSLEAMLESPASSMIGFLDNHGLLDVLRRPRWRTVTGGSREYVRWLSAPIRDAARVATPVVAVMRDDDGARVIDARGGVDRFDHVVMATHADTSLRILGDDASERERRILSTFRYERNRIVLHRDTSLLPRRRRVWSSWNYLSDGQPGREEEGISLSYWMNRLQNLRTDVPVVVTVNPAHEPRGVVSEHVYHHPRYDVRAARAQSSVPSLQGVHRTWFCGSYCGYGFHEDALRSGLEVAAALGSPPPWWPDSPRAPTPALLAAGR